jgi:radical SAM protein with 4Fe4S-binding SPASM domain
MPFYSACYAPFTSLHIEPNGNVKACCMNQWHHLGNLEAASLRSIWEGPALQQLRDALVERDFAHGCESCASEIRRGSPDSAERRVFDSFRVSGQRPAWPSNLEFALSNTCNLQCVMCNGELSSAIRRHREGRPPLVDPFGEAFFDELDDFLPHLASATFLGGEPFLARSSLRVMERLLELGLAPECSVITNGTRLDGRVRRLVGGLPMNVSVSIDAIDPDLLQRIRVGVDPAALFRNIEEFRHLTAATGHRTTLSFSLMRSNYRELAGVFAMADRLDCDLFVVKVFHPGRFSLYHAAPAEIEEALAQMERDDVALGSMVRNRSDWEHQLDWVRGLAERRDTLERGEPTAIGSIATVRWVGTVLTFGDLLIRRVDPVDLSVAGVEVGDLVGRSMVDLQQRLTQRLGSPISTDVRYRADGVQLNTIHFDPPEGEPVCVRAACSVDDRGQHTWRLGEERPAGS